MKNSHLCRWTVAGLMALAGLGLRAHGGNVRIMGQTHSKAHKLKLSLGEEVKDGRVRVMDDGVPMKKPLTKSEGITIEPGHEYALQVEDENDSIDSILLKLSAGKRYVDIRGYLQKEESMLPAGAKSGKKPKGKTGHHGSAKFTYEISKFVPESVATVDHGEKASDQAEKEEPPDANFWVTIFDVPSLQDGNIHIMDTQLGVGVSK